MFKGFASFVFCPLLNSGTQQGTVIPGKTGGNGGRGWGTDSVFDPFDQNEVRFEKANRSFGKYSATPMYNEQQNR